MSMKTATKRIPIIEELFYDTKGDLLKSPDVITFRAQDNYANLLVINLEDGIEDGSLVLVNFTPKNAVVSYTSHWFYARPLQNVREYIIVGEATPRVFSSYVIEVPRLVLNNYKENTTIENEITIVKRYGFHDLGVFNNYTDLINAHPANVELEQNNGFAYILNDSTVGGVLRKKGYYQVIYDNGNYTWVVRDNVMNFGLEQKQYETKKAFIAPGYANIKNVPNVESTVIEALWRDLSVIINDINDLKAFYDLQFATQETDTVYLEIDKVNESYFTIKADIKIDEVENDLLGKNENGLYVKHDISKAEKDLVDDIKETLDTHIEDLSNPHEVNAEQINTYEKEAIDQKDLDTLNEAKGYTYSQDIIDAKDQAILQEAKDYASEVADTFTKNEIIARDQAVLDEAKEYTDTNFVSNTTLDLQLLEKLNIRPNGTDLLVVGGKINTVYIDSLYITDIETVGTIPEMLALPNMKRGDIAIVVDENSSYVLTQTPSNVLGNWAKLLVQPSVISVNGKTGVVSIGISDIENLQGILDGKLSIITYESDKVILEQQIATSHLPKGFTTGTSPNYNVNIPNLVLSDGLQIAVSFNEANTAPPYLSLNSGTLIKINTLYGTALSPLILPNRYYILTYHIATNVWTIQMYNQMTNADIVNKTTEPKVISGKVLGDRLDEVESEIINYVNQGDNVLENSKQETLVSGVNIKTVGMQSLLGSGNISIPSTEEFASKQELAPYISSKNVTTPDLKGKTEISAGVYRYRTQDGVTMDYNINNGYVILNGTRTSGGDNLFLDLYRNVFPNGTRVSFKYYYVSGTFDSSTAYSHLFANSSGTPGGEPLRLGSVYRETIFFQNYEYNYGSAIPRIFLGGGTITFNNFTFRVQLEKGSVATPYAVPSGVIPYIPEVKTQLDSKLDKTVAEASYVKTTNIKTVNGETILGAGNLEISGVDLDLLPYMNYSSKFYYDLLKSALFKPAWEHSLLVDPAEISVDSTTTEPQGSAQYPNGETEGVIIPYGIETIGANSFRTWVNNNQPLVIPNSVLSIGNFAFRDWSSNNQPLEIPNSVTSIGNSTFSGWVANNEPLVIPNTVETIGTGSFSDWTSNTHPLVIPSSVRNIGPTAFLNWSLVPYVEMKSETPPTLMLATSFNGQNDAPIYVPDVAVEVYKTADRWSSYADRIFPVSEKP